MPCRFNRQRLWYHRILLEALGHESTVFVTLTYRDPPVKGELVPQHLQSWLKRLRRRFEPHKIRYFAVGEYGDFKFRPHYHVVLFGLGQCQPELVSTSEGWVCRCPTCSAVRETWTFGWSSVRPFTMERAKYIAKYTLKKMTMSGDKRLLGRHPEFARMSLVPGIGASAMWDVASVMMKYGLPMPSGLNHIGARKLPLGRYLRMKLSEYAGIEKVPYEDQSLSMVRAFAFSNNRSISSVYKEIFGDFERSLENKVRVSREKAQIQSKPLEIA